jgi:NAD(P)H-flavin reductase
VLPKPDAVHLVDEKHSSVVTITTCTPPLSPVPSEPRSDFSDLTSLEKQEEDFDFELPAKRLPRHVRHARFTWGNVYRRLFSIVFVLNAIALIVLSIKTKSAASPPLSHFATAAAANIFVAIWFRQDYVVNALFKATWLIPLSAPLRIRRLLAKIYEYGGVHSGAAISSVVWFALLTGYLTREFAIGNVTDKAVITLAYVLLSLFVLIIVAAYPTFRMTNHNTFENVHRWAGWFSLALFWVEIVLFACTLKETPDHAGQSLGQICIRLPSFWLLLITSLHVIYPWLRLRKLYVEHEKLSDHAVRLRFKEQIPHFVGLRLTSAPLREWHSFAAIPNRPEEGPGGSVLISNNGDWTNNAIQNAKPYYWIKGVPVTGVLCMAQIFKRVVIVTTGSGIGPCLGVMQDIPKTQCRVLWSTPKPYLTYGQEILDEVHKVDPKAVIINTRPDGVKKSIRPDLVTEAYKLYKELDAEAVWVISNPKLTKKVVYGLESRGVPCFGPIWDS